MQEFTTQGVCAKNISFAVEDGCVKSVRFTGGCPGNLEAISALVEGMSVEEVKQKLAGIRCGNKLTSCPDQLVQALSAL